MYDLSDFGYPGYFVDETGRVYREKMRRGRLDLVEIRQSMNSARGLKVNIVNEDGEYTSTTVARLVALAYVHRERDSHDRVIHRNFDLLDNRPENLLWRPGWIAQYWQTQIDEPTFSRPRAVQHIESGVIFETILDAVQEYGCMAVDILLCCQYQDDDAHGRHMVADPYPTYSQWRFVD